MEIDLTGGTVISDSNVLELVRILKSNPAAKTLRLAKCGLTNSSTKKILILLLSNAKIKHLDLSDNFVTEEILWELGEV